MSFFSMHNIQRYNTSHACNILQISLVHHRWCIQPGPNDTPSSGCRRIASVNVRTNLRFNLFHPKLIQEIFVYGRWVWSLLDVFTKGHLMSQCAVCFGVSSLRLLLLFPNSQTNPRRTPTLWLATWIVVVLSEAAPGLLLGLAVNDGCWEQGMSCTFWRCAAKNFVPRRENLPNLSISLIRSHSCNCREVFQICTCKYMNDTMIYMVHLG